MIGPDRPFAAEVSAARAGQREWSEQPLKQRLRTFRELRHRLVESAEDLAKLAGEEVERDPGQFISTDVLSTCSAIRYLETDAERILKPRRIGGNPLWLMGTSHAVSRRPHGVVGIIGTWNYPLFLNAVPIVHALAAGNAVLWKPSERTPRFAARLGELFRDSGSSLTLLPATREAGPQLAEADIDFLHFTGSESVGKQIASTIGARLIPSVLELSGCDATFVLADANVELAARTAWYGAVLNRGRTCMAIRRAFVHRSLRDRFLAELERCKTLPGSPKDAVLLTEVSHDSSACTEASFAPQLAMLTFDEIDEAITKHAACGYRLTASIFTADPQAAEAWCHRLGVGHITFNDAIVPTAHPATPFSGRGRSGWGPTQGDEGLLAMTVPAVVSKRRGTFRPHIDTVLKADAAGDDIAAGMLAMTHGRSLGQRWRGLKRLIGSLGRFGKR